MLGEAFMINKYDLVVWDVDGTLLNTAEGIITSAQYIIHQMGYNMPSEEIMKSYIGPPIQDSFARTLPISKENAMEMANAFRERYKKYDLLKAVPYEGVLSVCETFFKRGIGQAVATYKRQDYADIIVDYFGFSKYMNVVCGSDNKGDLTKSDIIFNAVRESGVENFERVLMIGDTINDSIGAKKQGIDFMAVTYGFGFKNDACLLGEGIKYIVNKPEEICSLLEV